MLLVTQIALDKGDMNHVMMQKTYACLNYEDTKTKPEYRQDVCRKRYPISYKSPTDLILRDARALNVKISLEVKCGERNVARKTKDCGALASENRFADNVSAFVIQKTNLNTASGKLSRLDSQHRYLVQPGNKLRYSNVGRTRNLLGCLHNHGQIGLVAGFSIDTRVKPKLA